MRSAFTASSPRDKDTARDHAGDRLMARTVYIDLGANRGETVATYLEEHPNVEAYAFEPHPELAARLRKRFADAAVQICEAACWIEDGQTELYLGHPLSSTIMEGKRRAQEQRLEKFDIDYAQSVSVPTIDFARWLLEKFSARDAICVKMDIEGAEYAVLERMVATRAIALVSELRCEWHWNRFPMGRAEHDRILKLLPKSLKVVRWR